MTVSWPGGFLRLIVLAAALSFIALALWDATAPAPVAGTANPLPPLISCPNVDADTVVGAPGTVGNVTVADILGVVKKFGIAYGQQGYGPLWDLVSPYNSTSPSGTGAITVSDILYVVSHFGQHCPLVDTQIAIATRAISDPAFSSVYCDPALTTAMSCGGDPQFLIENASFLAGKSYYPDGTDVPGQGVRYISVNRGDGTVSTFNAARPEALIYKNGKLVAQSYFVDGSVPGWGVSPNLGSLGYLWNWLPNANLVPDSPAPNGRFADCFPDTVAWGPYSCPEVLPNSLQLATGATSPQGLKQLIEGPAGLAPVLRAVAAGAAGRAAGVITVGQIFGNFRVVCVYPNGGLMVVPVEDVNAPNC